MQNPALKTFLGLNNVTDPLRLGLNWLHTADNVQITKTGALRRRDGYSKALAGAITGAYVTRDLKRTYLVDGGSLKRLYAGLDSVTLATGLAARPMHWAEVNDSVYYGNGQDCGIIGPGDTLLAWDWPAPGMPDLQAVDGSLPPGMYQVACTYLLPDGRETGAGDASAINLSANQALQITNIPQVAGLQTQVYIAPADSTVFQLAFSTAAMAATWNGGPDQLGIDLVTQFLDPIPARALPTFWRGRMYVVEYFPEQDQSAIWASEPLGYHLFNLNQNFLLLPGECLLLAPTETGLVIGTNQKITAYDGDTLTELADYGVVPGWSVAQDDASWLFWSLRGLCRALPFANLTQQQISVAPGSRVGAAVVQQNGEKHYIAALQTGGAAFNQRST